MDIILCGCGYGKGTHTEMYSYRTNKNEFVEHELGIGTCCRMIATGDLIPTNFRHEAWYNPHTGETNLVEVCTAGGQSMTVYTLMNQRGYSYHEKHGVWSLPKNKGSINSLPDET